MKSDRQCPVDLQGSSELHKFLLQLSPIAHADKINGIR